jgi:hypothetical protein
MITRSLPKTFSSTCRWVEVREGADPGKNTRSRTCINYTKWNWNKVKSASNETLSFEI